MRLHAIDRLLNLRIEILDSQAQAVEAELGQPLQTGRVHGAWVDFDRKLTVAAVVEPERITEPVHERVHLWRIEVGRRTATEMQLRCSTHLAEELGLHADLLVQHLHVTFDTRLVAGDDLVATAVIA